MSMKYGDLISIIIPIFNTAQYLEESLDSVINQTYINLEIIIIDDGSTDGSAKICDNYGERDSRIIIIHQKNKGLSAARNAGLDVMTGEMVAFLDADDAYHPDYISAMVIAMIKEKADIVICKYSVKKATPKMKFGDKDKPMPQSEHGVYSRNSALRYLIDTKDYAAWNKLYKRELWSEIRYPVGRVYEDIETTCRIIECCERIYIINKILYLKRKNSDSITHTHTKKNEFDNVLAYTNLVSFVAAKTPDIFTAGQLNECRVVLINKMIFYYVRHLDDFDEKGGFKEKLKKQITDVGVENLRLSTKVGYWMICWCPWLLQILVPVYSPVRRFVWRVIRK